MKEKIIQLIEEVLQVPTGTITENTKAEEIVEWDSLAHVMIIGELEEKLGINIPLDIAAEIDNVADLIKAGTK